MTPTPEEQEELRVAIAEEMGWSEPTDCTAIVKHRWSSPDDGCCYRDIPPYTTSIDAIREAALERFKSDEDMNYFQHQLFYGKLNSGFDSLYVFQLTALDWCIAFARTAKIWRYKTS